MAYGERDPRDAVVIPVAEGVDRRDAPVSGHDPPSGEDEGIRPRSARGGHDPGTATDVTRPAGGTVPQAARPRPAEPSAVAAPSHRGRTRAYPGSYSFDPVPPVTWGRRMRSTLGVLLVVTSVGLALAAAFGLLAVYISQVLEGAVN